MSNNQPVKTSPADNVLRRYSDRFFVESKSARVNATIQPSLKASFQAFCAERGISFAEGVAAAIRCLMETAQGAEDGNNSDS